VKRVGVPLAAAILDVWLTPKEDACPTFPLDALRALDVLCGRT